MSRATNEEQFKFLISCIRYSNNGKVDFGHVARECKIVSKGAAAKRYERMMKSHGIASNAASIKPSPLRNSMKSERRESSSSVIKKRKVDAFLDEANPVDDEEGGYASNIKAENGGSSKEHSVVKEEEEQVGKLSLNEAASLMQYYETPATCGAEAEEGRMGDEETYTGGAFGAETAAAGYTTSSSAGNTYGLESSQSFDFSQPYGSTVSSSTPRSKVQGMSNQQPVAQYSMSDQGRFDSPVVLE